MSTITEQLVPILARPISDADRARAELLLLDWTGCAIAGRHEPAGEKMAAAFPDEAGPCTRIGSSSASPLMAALHNGTLGNVLEMDDVDKRAILHAAPTIMPAALAMAQYVGASAKDFLDAIIIGYETTIRIGRAVGPGHYAFWHNTATCGPFGAAAAACHLLKSSVLVSALGLAGTQAAGLWQTRHESDSMAKQLHAGHAAHAGVLAAFLSAQSFQGPRSILEGEQGFFAAMCPGTDPKDVLVNPDGNWVHHETSIKPYPACRHAHPTIDAALIAREQIDIDSLDRVFVDTYADAIKFCDNANPKTPIEAKFSLQHSAAVTLLRGIPQLSDFTETGINEPTVVAMRQKILVRENAVMTKNYPAHYSASITPYEIPFSVTDAYGDPENPMSEDDVWKKAGTLTNYAQMDDYKSDRLFDIMQDLEGEPNLDAYGEAIS